MVIDLGPSRQPEEPGAITAKLVGEVVSGLSRKRREETLGVLDIQEITFFDPLEAAELGLTIEEGWQLKLAPSEDGFIQTLISPEGEEVSFEEVFVTPEGVWITQAQIEAQEQLAAIPVEFPEIVPTVPTAPSGRTIEQLLEQLAGPMPTPERIIAEKELVALQAQLTPEEQVISELETLFIEWQERILIPGEFSKVVLEIQETFPGITDGDIKIVLGQLPEEARELAQRIWPEEFRAVIAQFDFSETKDGFYTALLQAGRNDNTEKLLNIVHPEITENQMRGVFGEALILPIDNWAEGRNFNLWPWEKKITPENQNEDWAQEEYENYVKAVKAAPDWARKWEVGYGNILSAVGSGARFFGNEGIADQLQAVSAEHLAMKTADLEPTQFNWDDIYTGLIEQIPTTLALMGVTILAFAATKGLAAPVIGSFASYILASLAGGGVGAAFEGALEAGGVYDAWLVEHPGDVAGAKQVADEVFRNNLILLGATNFAELAAIFAPGGRVLRGAILRGFIKVVRNPAGKIISIIILEDGQELAQEYWTRRALGREFVLDDEMKLVITLATMMGASFGTGGVIYQNFQEKVIGNLTPDLRTQFDTDKQAALARGLTEEQATEEALNKVTDTADGKKVIDDVIEVSKIDDLERALKPKTTAEALAQKQTFDKMRTEAPQIKDIKPKIPKPPTKEQIAEVTETEIKISEVERLTQRADEVAAEIEGHEDTIRNSNLQRLLPVWKRMQRRKDQPSDLTIKEYKDFTGKSEVPPTSLTRDKKHVIWTDALDSVVTEFGYETVEDLMVDLNRLGEMDARLQTLYNERASLNEDVKTAEKQAETTRSSIIKDLETLTTEIETEIDAFQVAIKGLKGEEARLGREVLDGLERELKFSKNTLETFRQKPDLPDATVLRSTIMAWAKIKGLTQKTLQEIYSSVAGRRQLRFIKQEHLVTILEKVRIARPKRIRGKTIVTLKTEKKIAALKETLISNKQLTEESFNRLIITLGLQADRYVNANRFITESEGKALIRGINDEAVLNTWNIKVEESLDKFPDIKTERDRLNTRSEITEVTFNGEPIRVRRGNELRSMRYYVLNLQKQLKAPIYDVWQKINQEHLAIRQRQKILVNKLEASTPQFESIAKDEVALKRIEDYIAAKQKMAKIKSPENITEEEIKLAQELERQLFEFRNDVRYARFTEAYAGHSGDVTLISNDIPDAPKAALRRAVDIYEGSGAEGLRKFLDTQDWGVIKTGYDPRSIVKPGLHLYPARPTTFSKGHIKTRSGTEYTGEERTILQRYRSYAKQIMGLRDLSPLIRAFDRLYTEHAPKLSPETQRQTSRVLSRNMNEMKGYREDGGFINHMIERLYAQVASAVFWRPDLVLRNKFQNFAFNPDYHAGRFIDPRNRFMSKQRKQWFEVFISQEKGIEQDYLLYSQKPFVGFDRLTTLAHKTSLYPWSDKSNRAEAFFVRMNRIDRALSDYELDGDVKKLMKNSGLIDFEPRQQAEALELLAMDEVDYGVEGLSSVSGMEAFALYNAQQLVNNVHFLYDRAQRAPAEQGATGKTLGNILVFTRSWGERIILQGSKLRDPNIPIREKILAAQIIVGIIVAGFLMGEAYKEITGKSHNPYNPLNILTWTPGGLIIGVTEDLSNVMYLITQAIQGDRTALGQLPSIITGAADITIPFYKNLVQALDAITDMKDVDVFALRKIREMIDDEYEMRGGTHEVDRNLVEQLQKALLAGKDEPPSPQEKVTVEEELLATPMGEQLPFSLEPPEIYDMGNLNSAFSQILKDVEDITEANGYSPLAVAWAQKELAEAVWKFLVDRPLYKLVDEPGGLAQLDLWILHWQEREDIDPDKLEAYDRDPDNRQAYLGNITRRQYELLKDFTLTEDKELFLEEHPGLLVNLRDEWLRENINEDAQLALWGQADILSVEAYDQFITLVDELDIPDGAIPELTLPPRASLETHFEYLEMGPIFGWNSWETQLLLAKDPAYSEWRGLEPIDTLIASLELKVKNRALFDLFDSYSDKDSPNYVEEKEEREDARERLRLDNPEWVDDIRRIEAIEHLASDDIIEEWVERGRLVDKFTAGSSEVKVWLIDHPESFKWALDQGLLTDDGKGWNEGVLRINAQWGEWDDWYDALQGKDTAETTRLRKLALLFFPEYAKARRRRDAHQNNFPEHLIEDYVEYYMLTDNEDRKAFLREHTEFYRAALDILGWKPRDLTPSPRRDVFEKPIARPLAAKFR
ncbi:hypothetical protein LCGC14_0430940 [marine sediment metagenome]|uniref:Uncharacterized protein n=1 Tax=marine sediment metagenome TaxID=412755 RepID=A0A0F9SU84_9ZZZZ